MAKPGIFCLVIIFTVIMMMAHGERELPLPDVASQPVVFNSPEELRSYLQELDKYFVIAGRPRFGRSGPSGAIYSRNYYYPNSRTNGVPNNF